MTCDTCATSIEKHLAAKVGIVSGKVSYPDKKGEFAFDPDKISKDEIRDIINKETHYRVVREIEENPQRIKKYDLIIIGGGSAAFAAAIKANELGLLTLMVNGGLPIGGTCVNVGCVPSKTLIRAAESIHKASYSPFAGVKPRGANVDFKKIIQQKKELVSSLQQYKYVDILNGLDLVEQETGFAGFANEHTITVDGKTQYSALKFLIATGATTKIPAIPGLAAVPYLTNRSLFDLEEQPVSMIILGGGYIALEIAQAYHRMGTKVTLLQRSGHVLSKQTADVAEEITGHLRDEGVNINTGLRFIEVTQSGNNIRILAEHNGEQQTFTAQKILVSTGIKPNTDKLGAGQIGLELTNDGHIKVDEHLQTNIPNVFAAGDCINTPAYVYTAAYEGNMAVENAFSGAGHSTDYTSMPWVVFTDPQVAGVGMNEEEAARQGIPFEVSTLPLTAVPRNLAAFDTRGFVKLIRNPETDKLLGARIVAVEGSELTMELSLAIKFGIPVNELAKAFHAYLTLSESVKLAAIGFGKDVNKLSCCAA